MKLSFEELELAKAAYREYGYTTGFKNFRGDPMPRWDELPLSIQIAWKAAAQKIAAEASDRRSVLILEAARSTYLTYAESVGGKNFRGDPLPKWEELPDTTRNAWKAAASRVTHWVFEEEIYKERRAAASFDSADRTSAHASPHTPQEKP